MIVLFRFRTASGDRFPVTMDVDEHETVGAIVAQATAIATDMAREACTLRGGVEFRPIGDVVKPIVDTALRLANLEGPFHR